MQLLVFLQMFLEVEGFPTGGLRAGEGFLVHVLVLLVVLPGKQTYQLPAPAPGHPTQAPQKASVFAGTHVQVLAVGEDFAAAFEVTQEDLTLGCLPVRENTGKIMIRKEEEGWKSFGIWICPQLPPPHPPSLFPTREI